MRLRASIFAPVFALLVLAAPAWTAAAAAGHPTDSDGDGVANNHDLCPFTPTGTPVGRLTGCSIAELCPCEGPFSSTGPWHNHAQYVSCVAVTAITLRLEGQITTQQRIQITQAAAQSTCGQSNACLPTNPCQNGGSCQSNGGGYTCTCPYGFSGTNCEMPPIVCSGGNPAGLGEFPWTLSLQRFDGSAWRHVCGATLLAPNYALTAASCVVGQSAANIRVVAGSTLLDDESGAQISGAASFTIHPGYTGTDPGLTNDIAIVVLAAPIALGGNVQAATLPADDSNDYAGLTAVLNGWGKTARAAQIPNNEQQKESADVLANDDCSSRFAGVGLAGAINPNHICSFSESLNACTGDIGGPVNAPDGVTRVIGVQSWPVDYAVPYSSAATVPRVATRTSAFLQWIADNTP